MDSVQKVFTIEEKIERLTAQRDELVGHLDVAAREIYLGIVSGHRSAMEGVESPDTRLRWNLVTISAMQALGKGAARAQAS